jgi:hypothetical protein
MHIYQLDLIVIEYGFAWFKRNKHVLQLPVYHYHNIVKHSIKLADLKS